ncbi:ADP-ribosylglycohydrolase family protein [Phyllobacterium zundukense]|uniref:ADP-ribosylglycohydrolase family protein n=1 Tax=Phyllobacterium zundukense TaxID=1867719 RepID=A0ACD4CVV5_9HYPH|nr:ADP-ribosylglycohydrolase family protein [Phyllobacterium zundukense]UXN57709.1 ADP-ribosylglycohydrolase family protein [Phyllobacterium zundukense]
MLSTTDIFDRIYSGFIGKAIGVRLGAPVEPTIWTYERIRDTYGEITEFLRDFRNFAADDDTNGPVYFIRALRDYGLGAKAEDVGKTWLNYAAEEHGMYWWGGFGISTEHTAYQNLRAGIPAPQSGSISQNGTTVAEQIGGQIFIDSWGWVHAGDPEKAAEASARAASVAHDGEGLNGARFCAAAIAKAFVARSIEETIESGLSTISPDSTYARVSHAVIAFHAANPTDWRACRDMLTAKWGYDRYPGVCHIIPNAGVLVMALIYGQGDLPRTVEIATMAGWDTDCNAGNAGAVVGTFQQVQPGWDKYRKPINDVVIASGVTGTVNVVDVPSFARELTVLALRLQGREAPNLWVQDFERRGVRFDFDAPGATHAFRTEPLNKITLKGSVDKQVGAARGALEIQLDRLDRGQGGRVFWKPFYRRSDFDDERYRPMFTPLVDDGQAVRFKLWLDPWEGDGNLRVAPYVRRAMSGTIQETGAWHVPSSDGWQDYEFTIPDGDGEAVDEIGILVEYFGRLKFSGRLFFGEFSVSGKGRTIVDPAKEALEWGGITRFTRNRGHWSLEQGRIHAHTASDADAWTGNAYLRDISVSADLQPLSGSSHLVVARAQGTSRFYAAGFQDGEAVILVENHGTTILARTPFMPEQGRDYAVSFSVTSDRLILSIDGRFVLQADDRTLCYGMAGLRLASAGRMSIGRFEIVEA